MVAKLRWLTLLLAGLAGNALADSYRMGVIHVEQRSEAEFRIVHQFSGVGEAVSLRRPPACSQSTVERHQPLRQGAKVSVTWSCTADLASLPLSLDRPPAEGAQYYLSWQAPDWQLTSVAVSRWPMVAQDLREAPGSGVNYLWMGITHILLGWDHLAFVVGLLALVPGWRRLLAVVTAFTLGHSLTLALATLELVQVSMSYVEAMIALSIVYLIAEAVRPRPNSWLRRAPASLAAFFGLFHGLGFASALRQVGVPEQGRWWSLLQFNLGVELGQLAFVGAIMALVALARRLHGAAARLPALRLIGVTAGYWTAERFAALAW